MNAQAKSSRRRMDNRTKRFVKSTPAIYYRLHPKTQDEIQCANRALRRKQQGIVRRKNKHANQS